MDENRDPNVPVSNGPSAAPPPPPPEWYYTKRRFFSAHKRLILGLIAGFLIGMFMGGMMSMAAVRHVMRYRMTPNSVTAPAGPWSGYEGRYELSPVQPDFGGKGSYRNSCPSGRSQDSFYDDQSDSYWRGYKQGFSDGKR